MAPKLERLLLRYENLALRIVDVSKRDCDAAKQATEEVRVLRLPYVRVYGPEGKLLGAVQGNHIEKIEDLLDEQQKR